MNPKNTSRTTRELIAEQLRSFGGPMASIVTTCSKASKAALLASLLMLFASPTDLVAADSTRKTSTGTKSLDEQVQEVKTDVLAIAAELNNLEERLIYPSNTQVAVFVALAEGESMNIDSARVLIDGELVSHHIYSFKELEALAKGGVQRIYTGNVRTGEHRLEIQVMGNQGKEKSFEATEEFSFNKEVDPMLLGVTLKGDSASTAEIEIKGW